MEKKLDQFYEFIDGLMEEDLEDLKLTEEDKGGLNNVGDKGN
uniref:Uncharacterized protein n=1 Tax=viral metagenome TaxID=1070528 RepID=A0A6M3JNA9_9ZZZZ